MHLEGETCVTSRIELDMLAIGCPHAKHYVIPGCEAHLRTGDRRRYKAVPVPRGSKRIRGCSECDRKFVTEVGLTTHLNSSAHHPLAYQCPGCHAQHADLSSLLAHVEASDCSEGVTYGTGSIGELLHFLWLKISHK